MNCEVCGKKTERTRNRFCSVECKGIASRKPPTVCPVCGELFTGKSGQKTCSRECGAAIQRTGKMSACSQCGIVQKKGLILTMELPCVESAMEKFTGLLIKESVVMEGITALKAIQNLRIRQNGVRIVKRKGKKNNARDNRI